MLSQNKILLIHPLGYLAFAAGRDISRVANIMPPLGLASMAAYIKPCGMGPEHIDAPLLQRLKKAGCWMMSLGIESGDEQLLEQHRHNADLDHLAQKIRIIKAAGILTNRCLIDAERL